MKDKKLKDKKLEKERLKKKCNPKLEIELIQLFRRNAVDGKFLSYRDIMKKLRIKKSYLAELIKPLEEMSFLEIKFVNYSSKKEERKLYKLNKRGLWHADKLEAPSLRTDELKTLHLHNRIRKQADSKIKKDFLT
ncbi:MAG: hypothetical protein HWN66_00960, partial [Candidatus Helarchaeota archaeon]|nr:hypothetical protein [Candidatus Helarchaeota archaeon]